MRFLSEELFGCMPREIKPIPAFFLPFFFFFAYWNSIILQVKRKLTHVLTCFSLKFRMGLNKIDVKTKETLYERKVTFSKRRKGLLNKAKELSVMCDVPLMLLFFSPSTEKPPKIFLGDQWYSQFSILKLLFLFLCMRAHNLTLTQNYCISFIFYYCQQFPANDRTICCSSFKRKIRKVRTYMHT